MIKAAHSIYAMMVMLLFIEDLHARERYKSEWVQYSGRGYTLCDGLVEELNRYNYPSDIGFCPWAVVVNYRDLKEPSWSNLDPEKYEGLLYQLQRLRSLGWKAYFLNEKDESRQGYSSQSEEYSREKVRRFIREGGNLQFWQIDLPERISRKPQYSEANGKLNLLQLRVPASSASIDLGLDKCPDIPAIQWIDHVRLVNDDLTAPDYRLNQRNYSGAIASIDGAYIRMFDGVPHRFSFDGVIITVSRDDLPTSEFCRIVHKKYQRSE